MSEETGAHNSVEGQEKSSEQVVLLKALPALSTYIKLYANSLGGNDAKAVPIYRDYESREHVNRLRSEVIAISQGRVPDELCLKVLGGVRRAKFHTYAQWGKMMLGLLQSRGM